MNILITILILGIVILVHEFGHFLIAKSFGIPVNEFAIGIGSELASYKGLQTKYTLRLIPMGGYVSIKGMEIDDDTEEGFNKKNPLQRFCVLFAGVFMNFLLAYVIIFILLISYGEYEADKSAKIGEVIKGTPAEMNIVKNDIIKKLDGETVENWTDIQRIIVSKEAKEIEITLSRDGREYIFNVDLAKNENGKYYLGIQSGYVHHKYGIKSSIFKSFDNFWEMFTLMINGFKMIVSGEVSAGEVSGPIGIVKIVDRFSQEGFMALMYLVALFSVNVGIFNLLPFPALDGGRIIFIFLEVFGMKVNKKIEENVHKVGIVFLLFLMIIISANDVFKIFH